MSAAIGNRTTAGSPATGLPQRPAAATIDGEYDYVVVGSGAGGGPLAANLAKAGYSVLVLETGENVNPIDSQVPVEHAQASEDHAIAGAYFPRHYADTPTQGRDPKFDPKQDGVFYPRGMTVGGSTMVNAMIAIKPFKSDWDHLAATLGDASWSADNMEKYWVRMENNSYLPGSRILDKVGRALHLDFLKNLGGHGFQGWLTTSKASPSAVLMPGGLKLARIIGAAAAEAVAEQPTLRGKLRSLLTVLDPNGSRGPQEGVTQAAMAVKAGKRNGPRDYLLATQREHPDRLTVKSDALVSKVVIDKTNTAVGVQFTEGHHLHHAQYAPTGYPSQLHQVKARREVIVSAGAYNTPQLLMLSGIGPKAALEAQGIHVKVDLPGVGQNLQDHYEVGIVSKLKQDLEFLKDAKLGSDPSDPNFADWLRGRGLYTTNGGICAVIKKSDPALKDPDLFLYSFPGHFRGYYQGYSADTLKEHNNLSWVVLQARSSMRGSVSLKSADPCDMPKVDFKYFQGPGAAQDLAALVDGVNTVRKINGRLGGLIKTEELPGPATPDPAQYIKDTCWGHHASCTVKIGAPTDPLACLDKDFQVYGTHHLRVVDASAFPTIPGFFVVAPTYMLSEKASDVIIDAAHKADAAAKLAHSTAGSLHARAGITAPWR